MNKQMTFNDLADHLIVFYNYKHILNLMPVTLKQSCDRQNKSENFIEYSSYTDLEHFTTDKWIGTR